MRLALLPLILQMILACPAMAGDGVPLPILHVEGNALRTSAHAVVRLQGVNVAGLEWSNNGEGRVLRSVEIATTDWKANVIRLPVAQDRWFGFADGQNDGGAAYRTLVDSVIMLAAGRRAYVILDLHWSDAEMWGKDIAQHKMPDMNSLAFWVDAATRYVNHPAVLFDLYNEPHDITWDIWKNGGTVTEKSRDGTSIAYRSPGMQKLVDVIRATGATNVIVAGGNDWAFDLSGIAKGYALSDTTGNGIAYAAHIYPWKGGTDRWDTCVTALTAKFCVLVGEVGCQPDPKQESPETWAPKVLSYVNKHNLSWTAWCFHPAASPCLLKDWNYTPTPYWGQLVKESLVRRRR